MKKARMLEGGDQCLN